MTRAASWTLISTIVTALAVAETTRRFGGETSTPPATNATVQTPPVSPTSEAVCPYVSALPKDARTANPTAADIVMHRPDGFGELRDSSNSADNFPDGFLQETSAVSSAKKLESAHHDQEPGGIFIRHGKVVILRSKAASVAPRAAVEDSTNETNP